MVNHIREFLNGNGILQEILQQLQAGEEQLLTGEEQLLEQQASLASTTLKATTDTLNLSQEAKSLSNSNMMDRNFAGDRENGSKYVDAQMAGLKASKQLQSQATSRVTGLLNSLGGVKIGESSDHTPAWYEMQMRRIQNAESSEASQENLDEIKDNIERKAQEAVAPTDANGQPIEAETAASTGQAAPMPENSGSNPASAADIAPISDPSASVAAAPLPGGLADPAAPQSIDITV